MEDDDDDDDAEVKHPQKKFFRTRAHVNVLNANDFWWPTNPASTPFLESYPALAAARGGTPPPVEFVDIGCGYGSLLIELAKIFPPETLMLGIEIRPKVVEYVQHKVIAMRHDARRRANGAPGASESSTGGASAAAAAAAAAAADASTGDAPAAAAGASAAMADTAGYRLLELASANAAPACENVWAVHNNAQRFMPNFFGKGQLSKLFFCFADPHFKRKNHRKRIVTTALLPEYAYCLGKRGRCYVITDVADLMTWLVEHFLQSPLFERLTREQCAADAAVPALIKTDEGLKVTRNNGNMYIAVFEKRDDPLAPLAQPPTPNDNALAALVAADAGYTPQEGGERRGMTW